MDKERSEIMKGTSQIQGIVSRWSQRRRGSTILSQTSPFGPLHINTDTSILRIVHLVSANSYNLWLCYHPWCPYWRGSTIIVIDNSILKQWMKGHFVEIKCHCKFPLLLLSSLLVVLLILSLLLPIVHRSINDTMVASWSLIFGENKIFFYAQPRSPIRSRPYAPTGASRTDDDDDVHQQ